jgi:NTE family protein
MRILCCSGGGSRGASSIGALKHIILDLGVQYDAFCGVSVGALNTSFMAMFPKGQEKDALLELLDVWNNITTRKVHKPWLFGAVHALFKQSLYNSQPLQDLVRDRLSLERIRKAGRKVSVGAVCLETGEYRAFTQDDDCFVNGVLGSAAFPGFLCPIKIDGKTWIDGGVKNVTPIAEAVYMGATKIDVLVCSPETTTEGYDPNSKTLKIAQRTIDLMSDEIMANDFNVIELINEQIKLGALPDKRHIDIQLIRPEFTLCKDSLKFDQDEIQFMMKTGYDLARKNFKI